VGDKIPSLAAALIVQNPSLSIKLGNWFYWADRTESKESPVFMRI